MVREWDPVLFCYINRPQKVRKNNPWQSFENTAKTLALYSCSFAAFIAGSQLLASFIFTGGFSL